MKSNSSINNTALLTKLPQDEVEIAVSSPKNNSLKKNNPFTVVAIGASAGGLEAITQLLKNLSPTTGMAFIYVQHLSPDHKSMLSSILSKTTQMQVQDIDDMEKMIPNNVYVIPYNKGIEVIDGHINLIPRSQGGPSISIDILFSSLAETHKENVIGVVLSGSAHDGTIGLRDIKLAGGITFAQDGSARFDSMPNSAIADGTVDYIMSPAVASN
ncbi:MAG: chemotaxis protein CheB [Flavobacterium sp.]|nr:chemotaxis protein CheB [Flavobacterium sp.]